MEQLINITDAVFLGHVGEIELGASAIAGIYYLAIYMLGFGFSINGSSKEWRARLQGNRQDFFSRLIFPFGIGYLSLPSHSYGFPIYIKEADRFLGYLSNGNPILGLA